MNSGFLPQQETPILPSLPPSLEESHKIILESYALIQELQSNLKSTSAELFYQKNKVHELTQKLFGRSSEKRVIAESDSKSVPLPLVFKEEPTMAPEAPAAISEVKGHKRAGRRRRLEAELKDSEGRFPEHLPRKQVVLDDGEEFGEKVLVKEAERLCVQPSQLYVEEIIRVVRKDEEGKLSTPELPATVLPRTCVDATFLAWIIIQKFQWHLPLNRQEQMLKAQGFNISRDTLIRYVIAVSELLDKLYQSQVEATFTATHLYGDETPVLVCKGSKGDRKYSKSYFWPFMSSEQVTFLFAVGRGVIEIKEYLKEYKGKLQVDGYKVYESLANKFPDIQLAFCWAHARRRFIKAEKSHPEEVYIALRHIGQLYRIERLIKEQPPDTILRVRQRVSKKIVNRFRSWVTDTIQLQTTLPKSPLGEALSYVYARFEGLSRYLDDPLLTIDSNPIERAIRPVAVGRKNWMFCASETGARAACIFYSLIASCKLHGIEPFDYLVDILNRIGDHSQLQLHELLPGKWTPKPRKPFDPSELTCHRQ